MKWVTAIALCVWSSTWGFAAAADHVPFRASRMTVWGGVVQSTGGDVTVDRISPGHWISMQVSAARPGAYRIHLDASSDDKWDIHVDGDLAPSRECVSLKHLSSNAIFLDTGEHSLIFRHCGGASLSSRWRSISLLPSSQAISHGRQQWVSVAPGVKRLQIGRMYSATYVNVNIARGMALMSKGNHQYLSYYDPEGHLVVGRRRHDQTYFEKYWVPIRTGRVPLTKMDGVDYSLSNPHNFISMQMDGDGYMHLVFGQHGVPMHYLRSRYANDISAWDGPERGISGEPAESKVTYPFFIKLPSGDLLLVFRSGVSGSGRTYVYRYDVAHKSWTTLRGAPLIDDGELSSQYFWWPVVTPTGTLHLAWTWRVSDPKEVAAAMRGQVEFSGFTNRDISYARSDDGGVTWSKANGSPLRLPICRRARVDCDWEQIQSIPMGESFFNHFGSDYDSAGRPHFVYSRWNNARDRITQQWHLYFDGNAWKNSVITDYRRPIGWTLLQQQGRASTDLARPGVLVTKDDAVLVLSRARENGNAIELYLSSPPDYTHWRRHLVFDGPTGGWEPQVDMDLWHVSNTLQLLLVGVTDRGIERPPAKKSGRLCGFVERLGLQATIQHLLPRTCPKAEPAASLLPIDPQLAEDVGYLLEVEYQRLAARP